MFVLEVETEGLAVSVRVNDVEIFADGSGKQRAFQTKINGWVVEGKNDVEVWLGPVLDDEGRPFVGQRAFQATVIRGHHGEDPGPAGRILSYTFDLGRDLLDYETILPMWNASFDAGPAFGRWAWQDAPASPFGEADARQRPADLADQTLGRIR